MAGPRSILSFNLNKLMRDLRRVDRVGKGKGSGQQMKTQPKGEMKFYT